MAINISKLIGIAQGSKVVSTHIVDCKQCSNESVDAVLIVFDDGYTVVSCPVDRGNRPCRYEVPPRPTKWYNNPWLTLIALVVLAVIITWISNLNILPFE